MLQEIKNVFSKSYQEDIAYQEFKYQMRKFVKLKNASEGIDAKIDRLRGSGYVSNCRIKVGDFS